MIKLYCFPRSGNSREVKIALAEKNLPYEPINIHANPEVKESADFKKASPKATVPAIIDGDVYLSEALEINKYLDKKYPNPPLLPESDEARKRLEEFVKKIDKQMILNIGLLVIECILKPKAEQREDFKTQKRGEVTEGMKGLDQMLEGKEYLFGSYSLADIAVTPHLAALPILGMQIPSELKNLSAWFERIKARPSFQKSLQ